MLNFHHPLGWLGCRVNRKSWFKKAFGGVQDILGNVADVVIPGSGKIAKGFDDAVLTPTYHNVEDAARQSYDMTVGPNNPISSGLDSMGFHKAAGLTSAPSWEELGKPGEAFYNDFNEKAGVLPPSWRQYAAPVTAFALNFVPGVGPLLSAGFQTAYNAGGMQANQKGMDWGKVGTDAAINFGTAAAQMGATKLANSAKAAQTANTVKSATPSAVSAFNGGANLSPLASTATNAAKTTTGAINAGALSAFNGGSSAAMASNMSKPVPDNSSLSYGSTLDSGKSTSLVPSAVAAQAPNTPMSTKITDSAYNAGVKSSPQVVNQALTATLAPEGAKPISGAMDNIVGPDAGVYDGYQYGDQLGAFGDASYLNTPNPTGRRIGADAIDEMTMKIGANNYLQQQDARDQFLPAGQTEVDPNTPYSSQMSGINTSTDKAYQDLLSEADNYNAYYGILDANPTMTQEQMNQILALPEAEQPRLNGVNLFQGIRPMNMFNTSMVR